VVFRNPHLFLPLRFPAVFLRFSAADPCSDPRAVADFKSGVIFLFLLVCFGAWEAHAPRTSSYLRCAIPWQAQS
jgi:hypothetical protein